MRFGLQEILITPIIANVGRVFKVGLMHVDIFYSNIIYKQRKILCELLHKDRFKYITLNLFLDLVLFQF